MAVETTKDSVCINQIIEQKNESFIVEGDSIIPDIKPDILNAISTSGTVCIYKKEILDAKVRIDGSINTYVMYLADDENGVVRSINSNIDFTQVIDLPNAKPDMMLETMVTLKSIECRVINGRKVNIKAVLDTEVKISSNENIDIINSVNAKGIQMLNTDLTVNSLVGNGITKAYAKDTLMIDNTDNLAEVMKLDLRISNKDTKISYNKVLAKADMNVKLLYLTEDNRINAVEGTIPVMGFIDIQDISEDNICDIRYEIKNLVIKPNSVEDHSIYVEVEVEIFCQAYQNQQLNLIQDLYCPLNNLTFTQKQIRVMQKRDINTSTCNIRERQQIDELQGNQIYDVAVEPEIIKQTLLNDRVLYEGEVKLSFLFATSENSGNVDVKSIKVPFNFNMDFEGVNASSNIDTSIEVGLQDFIVTSDNSVDIKVDLIFTTSTSRNAEVNIIDDIQEDNNVNINTCSMVVYFVKPGDTLWSIAKTFGSTIDEIARVNGIEMVDKIDIGQQLFIPRYNG